jgi:hypothetical protein
LQSIHIMDTLQGCSLATRRWPGRAADVHVQVEYFSATRGFEMIFFAVSGCSP